MKLKTVLQKRKIPYQQHTHLSTCTAQGLAQVEHVSGYMVAKPVVVHGPSGYAMCVVPAPCRLDLDRAAEVLHEPALRLATEPEMQTLFPDCELGAEPPVGSLAGLKTIMDARLRDDEYLVMQAGSHTEAIRIRRDDWEKLCEPTVARIGRP